MKKNYIQKILFFLNFLLIGGDLISFKLWGFTIRLVVLTVVIGLIHQIYSLGKINFKGPHASIGLVFIISMISSMVSSVDQVRTLGYIGFAFFVFFILMTYFYNGVLSLGENYTEWAYLNSCKLQVILILFEKLLWMEDRPHLWFYEPSYMAIYLSAYFGYCLHQYKNINLNSKVSKKYDLLVSILGLSLLMSTTAIFGVLFSIVLVYRVRGIMAISVMGMLMGALIHLFEFRSDFLNLVLGFAYNDVSNIYDLFHNLMSRSGTRIIRMAWAWEAFIENPIAGIGFGADQTYTLNADYPSVVIDYVTQWEDPHGNPFNNPMLEIVGTMGLFGVVSIIYFARKIYSKLNISSINNSGSFSVGIVAMMGAMQMEGTFLRCYVWALISCFFAFNARDKGY